MSVTHLSPPSPPSPPPSFGHAGRPIPPDSTGAGRVPVVRPLSGNEFTAVAVVAALAGALGLIGFANSFAAVMAAARPSFGGMAWSVPVGIDVGIAVFAALDLVLGRLNMAVRWVRLIPWSLTAATIYLNVATEHTMFGRISHAVLPALWVVAVEIGAHVVRVRAGIAAGTRMDRIRASRWLLAPWPTFRLWRRMVLWEIRSYPDALTRERDRVLALTALQDTYGKRWRKDAPRRTRALYRLGELSPTALTAVTPDLAPSGTPSGTGAGPAALPAPVPARPPSRTGRTTTGPGVRPRAGRSGGRSRAGSRTVPEVADLMPLGRSIAADLESRGVPLTRDTLAARLRAAGHKAGSERVGALLARLKTETPTHPTGPADDADDVDGIPARAEGEQ